MRVNPTLANQLYMNYENGDTDTDSGTSILPSGTYTGLAAAKYVKDKDNDNDGKLSSDEVSISSAAFAALDKDSDGYVTKAEVKTALAGQDDTIYSSVKTGGSATDLDGLTESLLTGKSSASNAKLTAYVKLAAKDYLSENDKNNDGVLSASEVTLTSNAFKSADTNGDGGISQSELQASLADDGESIYKYYKNGGTQKLGSLTSTLIATI